MAQLDRGLAHVREHLQQLRFQALRDIRIASHDELGEELVCFLLG